MRLGIITLIQKLGIPKGLVQNLCSITLIPIIGKILAVCMKKRIIDKLDAETSASQAEHRIGRSTTEHVFAAKVLM